MIFKLKTAQTTWIVTAANVKTHLDISVNTYDTQITQLIVAAQKMIEEQYDLRLSAATYYGYLDKFPTKEIEIWLWPIASISSVKYTDGDGNTQTVTASNYATDLVGKPARIYPVGGYSWPDTKDTVNAVTVEFVTGFTSPETVPDDIEHAMYMILADWWDNREDRGYRFPRLADKILHKYKYR